ncbi:hypothetical protein EDI_247230 [Entamoeba dispar SAW760]|uniref:Ras-GAP domain-containing protein n=1 Tax=Entamoeba dispar (strain ATCC PRA-260 / SAW760) TaxID=370354 RepID=B0EUU4_ENTDS|nr:uncharacterized protein EDI_247230 [Entamoeba dispar SAW760]EDR21668.1 hypothetical protein EDI_247230 [Entamoeba dispar SAW760]|eukprot:EDR21668.1 hypothetical protein EDI_247230 [Entamoeba dispar SAW760]
MNQDIQLKIPTFEEVFLSLEPDILSGVLKHFCSRDLSEEEIDGNMKAIFYFFVVNGKVLELMEWVAIKEIAEIHNPNLMFQRNSIYNKIIRLYMDYDVRDIFQDSIEKLLDQVTKKNIQLNLLDSSVKYSQSDLKKVQEILESFFTKIFDLKLPDSFKYFMTTIGSHITESYPTATVNVLINIIFNRYIGSTIATSKPTKNSDRIIPTLKSISLIMKWMLSNELKEDSSWQVSMKNFAEIIKTNVVSWITNNVIQTFIDKKPKVKWEVAVRITKDIKNMVFKDSEQICALLPETTSRLLRILKDEYISSTTSIMDLFMKLQRTIIEQQSDIFSLYSEIAVLNQYNKELTERIRYFELRKRTDNDEYISFDKDIIESTTPMLRLNEVQKQPENITSINTANKQKLDAYFAKKREQEKNQLKLKSDYKNSVMETKYISINSPSLLQRKGTKQPQYISTPFTSPSLPLPDSKTAIPNHPSLAGSKISEDGLGVSLFSDPSK